MWKKIEFFALIMIVGMKGFVQGSCLEYGHSCWGAHGKRSDKATPIISTDNRRYAQNSKDFESGIFNPERYILMNILLNKNSLGNFEENLKNSNRPILMTPTSNEIDQRKYPDSTRNWNYNKFDAPLRKSIYLRTEKPDNQHFAFLKSRQPQVKEQTIETKFDSLNFLQKSPKPNKFENSHYLQPDIYSDEDQSVQDFALK